MSFLIALIKLRDLQDFSKVKSPQTFLKKYGSCVVILDGLNITQIYSKLCPSFVTKTDGFYWQNRLEVPYQQIQTISFIAHQIIWIVNTKTEKASNKCFRKSVKIIIYLHQSTRKKQLNQFVTSEVLPPSYCVHVISFLKTRFCFYRVSNKTQFPHGFSA